VFADRVLHFLITQAFSQCADTFGGSAVKLDKSSVHSHVKLSSFKRQVIVNFAMFYNN
jgi:hypothetical protein